MQSMKALLITKQQLGTNVQESKRKVKVTVKVMCSNLMGPLERSCHIMNTHAKYDRSRHKEHTCKV